VKETFSVRVPAETELVADEHRDVRLSKGTSQTVVMEKNARARLPEGVRKLDSPTVTPEGWVYHFPAECEVRTEAVNRWSLGFVIALAVLGICLWGTLIGCVIPLVIDRLGGDPAIASGALVATFVDVSGILIFFSAAAVFLL
jgi:magnesium transporter